MEILTIVVNFPNKNTLQYRGLTKRYYRQIYSIKQTSGQVDICKICINVKLSIIIIIKLTLNINYCDFQNDNDNNDYGKFS